MACAHCRASVVSSARSFSSNSRGAVKSKDRQRQHRECRERRVRRQRRGQRRKSRLIIRNTRHSRNVASLTPVMASSSNERRSAAMMPTAPACAPTTLAPSDATMCSTSMRFRSVISVETPSTCSARPLSPMIGHFTVWSHRTDPDASVIRSSGMRSGRPDSITCRSMRRKNST
jgi:hypothetical protein